MSERTDGHYLDTGEGPKPLTRVSGNALESKGQQAYRAYLDHRPTCEQCQTSLFICETAQGLWDAYKAVRS